MIDSLRRGHDADADSGADTDTDPVIHIPPPITRRLGLTPPEWTRPGGEDRWRIQRTFPGAADQVGQVRAHVREVLADVAKQVLVLADASDVELAASELATNAIRHTSSKGTTFGVAIVGPKACDCLVRIEVADLGGGQIPTELCMAPDSPQNARAQSGRGLLLVASTALRWGADDLRCVRLVWAEIGATGCRRRH